MERKNIKTLVRLLLHINQRMRVSALFMRESFGFNATQIYQAWSGDLRVLEAINSSLKRSFMHKQLLYYRFIVDLVEYLFVLRIF